MSTINLIANYYSACIIDEVHLNNQRSKLLFDTYFGNNQTRMPEVAEVNAAESFSLPNWLNIHRCKFIRFGEKKISSVLADEPKYVAESVYYQLTKENRGFAYHISILT